MDGPPPLPPPAPSPYDAILAEHLVSVPEARLFMGVTLQRVNWAGVEAAFGELLKGLPHESILAVYDDSLFGRGAKGFVVTDRHLLVVGSGMFEVVRLAAINRVVPVLDGFAVDYHAFGKANTLRLRVDERSAQGPVGRWLEALVQHNAPSIRAQQQTECDARAAAAAADRALARQERAARNEQVEEKRKLSARQALKRLEKLIERKRLGIDERQWLIALAAQAQALEDRRLKKGGPS